MHNAFVRFHERYDLLITPTVPLPAFEAGALVPPSGDWGGAWTDWSPFSYPFNLTTQPAASVPCGLTAAGLPIGLQVVGPIGADALVLRAARALEEAAPFPTLEAPRMTAGQPPDASGASVAGSGRGEGSDPAPTHLSLVPPRVSMPAELHHPRGRMPWPTRSASSSPASRRSTRR